MPIIMQTIIDVVPILGMVIVVGNSDGDDGGGNDGGGGDTCLQRCSDADGRPVCGRRRAGWQRRFCGNRHAVKIGSPIDTETKDIHTQASDVILGSLWCGQLRDGLTFVVRRVQAEHHINFIHA
jgi:hypothetical protein